jgi:hypothetical protein
MLAHGATGFGTSTSDAGQAFWEHRIMRRRRGATNAQKFFEASILHSVEYATHQVLEQSAGYMACDCRWCEALAATPVFNQAIADWHAVHSHGELTAAVMRDSRAGGIRGGVRRIVKAAADFAQDKGLAGKEEPKHLPVWRQYL